MCIFEWIAAIAQARLSLEQVGLLLGLLASRSEAPSILATGKIFAPNSTTVDD